MYMHTHTHPETRMQTCTHLHTQAYIYTQALTCTYTHKSFSIEIQLRQKKSYQLSQTGPTLPKQLYQIDLQNFKCGWFTSSETVKVVPRFSLELSQSCHLVPCCMNFLNSNCIYKNPENMINKLKSFHHNNINKRIKWCLWMWFLPILCLDQNSLVTAYPHPFTLMPSGQAYPISTC